MVVHDNDIEQEVAFLVQGAFDSIPYRTDSVEDRYHDRCLDRKGARPEIRRIRIPELRFKIPSYPFKMPCTCVLHLYLYGPVPRVDIVKLLLP